MAEISSGISAAGGARAGRINGQIVLLEPGGLDIQAELVLPRSTGLGR